MNDDLVDAVRLLVEQAVPTMVMLRSGEEVELGSVEHLDDLRVILNDIAHVRDQYVRGSSARSDFARAYNRLKSYISRLERRSIVTLMDDEGPF